MEKLFTYTVYAFVAIAILLVMFMGWDTFNG